MCVCVCDVFSVSVWVWLCVCVCECGGVGWVGAWGSGAYSVQQAIDQVCEFEMLP